MILFRYLQYGFRDTLRSLWRHKGMVLVSVLTVAVMLVVLGATVLLAANSEYIARNMEDELEVVVYLNSDVSREDVLKFLVFTHISNGAFYVSIHKKLTDLHACYLLFKSRFVRQKRIFITQSPWPHKMPEFFLSQLNSPSDIYRPT